MTIMSIRQSIKKLLMYKIYYGANKFKFIGENVILPRDMRVPGGGGGIFFLKYMRIQA